LFNHRKLIHLGERTTKKLYYISKILKIPQKKSPKTVVKEK
jgi:hypothetical protein